MSLAKRLHRFSHAPAQDLNRLLKRAGYADPELVKAVERVGEECLSCAKSGPPHPSRKLSLTRVDAGFNVNIQADFVFCTIGGRKLCVLHVVDTATSFSETSLVPSRSATVMAATIEIIWIYRHGAPSSFSSDYEFQSSPMKKFLSNHQIKLEERPVRRHNKTGVVERKHLTLKRVLERLKTDEEGIEDPTLLARATFFCNVFSGSRLLSSFELVRGYTPAILGLPPTVVTTELLQAYKEQVATRALQRLLSARAPSTIPPSALKADTPILYFYRSSKQSDPAEWRPGTVISAEPYLVRIRNLSGRLSSVAYEDIRLRPTSPLTRSLMEGDEDHRLTMPEGGEHDEPQATTIASDTEPSSVVTALMAKVIPIPDDPPPIATDSATRDIGSHAVSIRMDKEVSGKVLRPARQHILQEIQGHIGGKQVSGGHLSFAPAWILEEAFNNEMADNWSDAYEMVDEDTVPRSANKIGCHTVYKVKDAPDGNGELYMKARNVLHGNRDKDRFNVRRDSASADLCVIRLVISIGLILGFSFGTADVKGAYMQSGPAKRDIYVRPPKEFRARGKIWRLLRLPYGIVEAGRQWLCAIEDWMINVYKMERVFGVDQLFIFRIPDGTIGLIAAKVVDDFFLAGTDTEMKRFFENIDRAFKLGATSTYSNLKFLGCDIKITTGEDGRGSIEISMEGYLRRVRSIQITKDRKSSPNSLADDRERSEYRSMAGVLLYLGQAVLPQACLVASKMQQKLGMLKVGHLMEANTMLGDLKKHRPSLYFRSPSNISDISISTFSDASHGAADEIYGQTGGLCGLVIQDDTSSRRMFHPISWTSHKQRRVSYSSFGAEILAAANADDRGYDLKLSFRSLFPDRPLRHKLIVDSKALFETLTTLHQSDDYRLRKTVARIRASFESKELNIVRWIPGIVNVADALTKRNQPLSLKLNAMLCSGFLSLNDERGVELDSDTWA